MAFLHGLKVWLKNLTKKTIKNLKKKAKSKFTKENIEIVDLATAPSYAAYPPVVTSAQIIGYVNETSGIFHSRDIGVPFTLFGLNYLLFGDTFCHDSYNQYAGLVSNTVAIIDNESQPARSRYLTTEANGRVEPFINLTGDELAIEERDDDMRVALWAFGGVVEMEDGTGRVWFSKQLAHKNGLMEYIGTGLAKVTPRLNGHLRVQRSPEMVFGPHDAKIGTFSGIKVGDYIYLYGDSGNNQIVLSRVLADPDREDIIYDKYSYTYWNGSNYVLDPKEAKVVFQGLSQGSVVRTKLFGPGKPYLFVGVGAWGSSKIMMGASASLEGPWDLKEVYATEGINIKDKYRYCMYPHVWASDEEKAELVVSWCEPYPGGVIMARLQLAPVVDTVEEG